MKLLKRPSSLTTRTVAKLRSSIVLGDLMLGEQISEIELARQFGISKTPVREAIQQLRAEGLVRVVPQTGTFVFTMSAREVVELCELRLTLERDAMSLALEKDAPALGKELTRVVAFMEKALANDDDRAYHKLDSEYHACIFTFCKNRYFAEAYSRIEGQVAALRTHLSGRPQYISLSFGEHKSMARDILAGHVADIPKTIVAHIERVRQTYSTTIDDIAQADRAFRTKRMRKRKMTG